MQRHKPQTRSIACHKLISHKVFSKSSISTQIHQLIIYMSESKRQVDGFVGELTSAQTTLKILSVRSRQNSIHEQELTHKQEEREVQPPLASPPVELADYPQVVTPSSWYKHVNLREKWHVLPRPSRSRFPTELNVRRLTLDAPVRVAAGPFGVAPRYGRPLRQGGGSCCRVWGSGFGVPGSEFWIPGSGFRVPGSGLRVSG
jgi:hypothetical protein